MGRVEEQTEVKRRGREHIARPPSDYYRRVFLDLVSPSTLAMRYAYDFAGPDRLLFGSDHPWVTIDTMLGFLERMDLDDRDRAKILGLNASHLFRIS
jgi:predicted TIM-barrel fold metal-dependent hydrolase